MLSGGSIFVRLGLDPSGFNRGMAGAQGRMTTFGSGLGRFALLAGGALGVAGGFALKMAGDFEQSLNVFQAVAGATGRQMSEVSDLAKQLGQDITLPAVSASDAAVAMTELAKGGLSVEQAMAAAKGTLQLATAAQISHSEAAIVTARTLNAFGLAGGKAGKVADVLANAANKSTGEITDFALGFQMASAVAKQMGLTVEDTAALLMQLADAGIAGSDAGTSLKTMLMRLNPQTKKARDLMKELGIDVFDAKGRFVGIEDAIRVYEKALKDLNPEQRQHALQTLFGSDAVRAANIVLGKGADAFGDYRKAAAQSGTAQRMATAQTKGFKGALEAFRSQVETVATSLGMTLLPAATNAMRGVGDAVSGAEDEIRTFFRVLSSGTSVSVLGGTAAMLGLMKAVRVARNAYIDLRAAIIATNPLLAVASLAVGILVAAYIRTKMTTDEWAASTKRATSALRGLQEQVQQSVDSELNLAQAQLRVKQAADQVQDAERLVNRLRDDGKTKSEGYRDALLMLQQAKLDQRRATHELSLAEGDLSKSHAKEQTLLKQSRMEVNGLKNRLTELQASYQHVLVPGARAGQMVREMALAKKAKEADTLASSMDKVAAQAGKVRDATAKQNPVISAAAAEVAREARAVAELTRQLNRLPTTKEIDVFLTVHTNAQAVLEHIDMVRRRAQGGNKAFGGPVHAGLAVMVGEHGREMFVPQTDGMMVPNEAVRRMGGGGATVVNHFHVNGAIVNGDDLVRLIRRSEADYDRANGVAA